VGTSKHEKTGFCNYFFCSTELKVSNATTSFCNYFLSDTTEKCPMQLMQLLFGCIGQKVNRCKDQLLSYSICKTYKGALFFNVGFIAIQSSTF